MLADRCPNVDHIEAFYKEKVPVGVSSLHFKYCKTLLTCLDLAGDQHHQLRQRGQLCL